MHVRAVAGQDASTGNYPIHIACQNGHQEVAKLLIAKGADVNMQNNNGLVALHMSVEYDYYWTSKLLVANGADPTITSGEVCGTPPGHL
eukprot:COSAG01_NODE_228_length_21104_cov_210.303832_24_plen_89_part_00